MERQWEHTQNTDKDIDGETVRTQTKTLMERQWEDKDIDGETVGTQTKTLMERHWEHRQRH